MLQLKAGIFHINNNNKLNVLPSKFLLSLFCLWTATTTTTTTSTHALSVRNTQLQSAFIITRQRSILRNSRILQSSSSSSSSFEHNILNDTTTTMKGNEKTTILPTMIVFDLDDCLWSPEMYTLRDIPSIPEMGDLIPPGVVPSNLNNDNNHNRGCVGMKVKNGPTVRLFSGARRVLYELATLPQYADITIASASSSEEPTFSYSCLRNIEIVPGKTMADMFQYNQIGRTGNLSSDKRTHFRLLHKDSQIPYNEMLFFDDCNWGDHCATVHREFGVIGMRTPRGLQYNEFQEALQKYQQAVEQRTVT